MRTIHFKNGLEKEITQEIADYLKTRITNGCKNWQSFDDDDNHVFLIINLDNIEYID